MDQTSSVPQSAHQARTAKAWFNCYADGSISKPFMCRADADLHDKPRAAKREACVERMITWAPGEGLEDNQHNTTEGART